MTPPFGGRPSRPGETEFTGPGPSLAWSALCIHCGRTYISCLHEFPVPYACEKCVPVPPWKEKWLAAHQECRYGHKLTPENVKWRSGGFWGQCRICVNASKKAAAARKRASLCVQSGTPEDKNMGPRLGQSPTP